MNRNDLNKLFGGARIQNCPVCAVTLDDGGECPFCSNTGRLVCTGQITTKYSGEHIITGLKFRATCPACDSTPEGVICPECNGKGYKPDSPILITDRSMNIVGMIDVDLTENNITHKFNEEERCFEPLLRNAKRMEV